MPGGRIIIAHLTAEEARNDRLFNLIGWCLGITILTWVAWMPPDLEAVKAAGGLNLQQKVAFNPAPHFSVIWAILITLVSPVIGWALGWKAGIGPFFTGFMVSNRSANPPTTA